MKSKGLYTVIGAGAVVVSVAACGMVAFFPWIVEKQRVRGLNSQSADERANTLRWLREAGSARAIPEIVLAVRKGHSANLPERTSPVVQKLRVAQETVPVVYCLVDVVKRNGRAAVRYLKQALASDDPILRYLAASLLGKIGPDARRAVPDLMTALADSDVSVRAAAAEALGLWATLDLRRLRWP